MGALWYWTRRSLRQRARACVAAAVLLALLGGLSLASLAGARRTASAYPRFREAGRGLDVTVNAGGFEVDFPDAVAEVPGVVRTATYLSFLAGPVTPDGRPDLSFEGESAGSLDGLYFTDDRFTVTKGRIPDPSRQDEVAVNEHLVRTGDVRLGQRFDIGVFDPADEERAYTDDPPPPADRLDVTVVGVGLFPDEIVQDDTDRLPRALFTPAFARRMRPLATYAWTGAKLEGGSGAVERFKRDYLELLPDGGPASFRERAVVTARVQEAVRPLALSLAVFGALAAAVTVLLAGQALVRLLRSDRDALATLRALGAGPRLSAGAVMAPSAAAILAGSAGALAVALALSPLAPIGPLRRVEPDVGVSFDATVLIGGALALAVALGLVAVVAAARLGPHRQAGSPPAARPSALAGSALARLPVTAVTGLRLTLGQGRSASPARAALGGAVVAVGALVAALVFGTSLRALVDQPRLYGWDWDLTVLDEAGYGDIDPAKAETLLGRDPDVAAWSGVYFQALDLEGRDVAALGMEPGAAVAPPIVSGRPVTRRDEVVLGSATLVRLGKKVGDTVTVGSDAGSLSLRIVGTAVLPTIGPVLGAYTSLGEGAVLAYDRVPGWDAISTGPKALFVRFRPGADRSAALERISEGLPGISRLRGTAFPLPVQRPAEIVNYESMGSTPAVLGGVLVVAALVSLGLTLASTVSRRRRELSVLKALGFTSRQASATVVWHSSLVVAVGVVIGVPLGTALGRWLWRLFAERLTVLAQPRVPALVLLGLVAGLLALAYLVAAVPARRAARIPVAGVLRSE